MTKKKMLFLALGFLAMAAVVGYSALWLSAPKCRIEQEDVTQLKMGMTHSEVEALLGVPSARVYNQGGHGLWFGEGDWPWT